LHRGEHAIHIGRDTDVAAHGERAAAYRDNFGDRPLRARLIRMIVNGDRAAQTGELKRNSFANAFACTRDQGDLSFQG
jgi:hypothetical protein